MGRVCGGAHEISGIPAPLWHCGWVVGGFLGWGGCLVWWVGVWVVVGWVDGGGMGGWVCGGGVVDGWWGGW